MNHGSEEALIISEFLERAQKSTAENQRRLSICLAVGCQQSSFRCNAIYQNINGIVGLMKQDCHTPIFIPKMQKAKPFDMYIINIYNTG